MVRVFWVSLTSVNSVFIGRLFRKEGREPVPDFRITRSAGLFRRDVRPVAVEDRPQHLVVVLPVPEERSPQHTFRGSAELAEGAIAAAVLGARTRFEAADANCAEGKIQHEARGVGEQS